MEEGWKRMTLRFLTHRIMVAVTTETASLGIGSGDWEISELFDTANDAMMHLSGSSLL